MVYTDNGLRLANALSLEDSKTTPAFSPTANVIDLAGLDFDGTTDLSKQDIGIGNQMVVQIYPGGTLDNVAAMQVDVVLGVDDNFASGSGNVVVGSTGAILLADWNDKEKWPLILRISPNFDMDDMDPADVTSLRYMGIICTGTGGSDPDNGTVTADLVLNEQPPRRFYPTKSKVL